MSFVVPVLWRDLPFNSVSVSGFWWRRKAFLPRSDIRFDDSHRDLRSWKIEQSITVAKGGTYVIRDRLGGRLLYVPSDVVYRSTFLKTVSTLVNLKGIKPKMTSSFPILPMKRGKQLHARSHGPDVTSFSATKGSTDRSQFWNWLLLAPKSTMRTGTKINMTSNSAFRYYGPAEKHVNQA